MDLLNDQVAKKVGMLRLPKGQLPVLNGDGATINGSTIIITKGEIVIQVTSVFTVGQEFLFDWGGRWFHVDDRDPSKQLEVDERVELPFPYSADGQNLIQTVEIRWMGEETYLVSWK